MKDVIIYGCGNGGQNLFDSIKGLFSIIGCSDANDLNGEKFAKKNNIIFIAPDELHYWIFDYVIVSSFIYAKEITEGLLHSGIQREQIITISGLNSIVDQSNVEKSDYICNLCGNKVFDWVYGGIQTELFLKKKVIGGGRRKCICPACGCNDRQRFEYDILGKNTTIFEGGSRILHFAPEECLRNKLMINNNYISADILSGRADIVADITSIPFDNNTFDYIICNHVFEHIKEQKLAFEEIHRCLTNNGKLIFTVPICWEEKTQEGTDDMSEQDRLLLFGQKDHVRLYGNDLSRIVSCYGYNISLFRCREKENVDINGMEDGETVFICTAIDC